MSDPIDQTATNPQSLVDEALSTKVIATTPVTTTATLTPLTPLVPELTPATPTPAQSEPVTPPTPIPTPAPNSVPMGDDTPLAFATAAPSANPTPTTPVTPPVTEQTSSYLPPTPPVPSVPPAPTMEPEQPRKKSKKGIVVGGIMALMLFVIGGVAGYQYITTGEIPLIAESKSKKTKEERDAAQKGDGYKAQIKANQTKKQAIYVQNIRNKLATLGNPLSLTPQEQSALADADKDVAARVTSAKQNAEDYVGKRNGMYEIYDADGKPIGWRIIQAEGVFEGIVARAARGDSMALEVLNSHYTPKGTKITSDDANSALVMMARGYTWVPGGVGCTGSSDNTPSMDIAGVESSTSCGVWHFTTCTSGAGMNGVGCDVATSNNDDNPPNPTSPPSTPTMSCQDISSSPDVETTTVAIGNTVTFTCAGTIAPLTAGTLSYNFRYNINSGAYSTLTNVTPTTASLTVAACGTYSVECQTCATIEGTLRCDPVWTGAITP